MTKPRSPVPFKVAFSVADRFKGTLPIWNSRARATLPPADTEV